MAAWVTMNGGELRKYNDCGYYEFKGEWVILRRSAGSKERGESIAYLRSSNISIIEFEQPCEITWIPDVVEKSIEILLARAKRISDWSALRKLADLARLLRQFNPQRRTWK